jgi:hypothetical protein
MVAGREVLTSGQELALVLGALVLVAAAPCRIDREEGVLDEMTLGHRRSRIGALCALARVLGPAASARAAAPHAVLASLPVRPAGKATQRTLERGLMPILTAIALLAVAYALRWRRTVYAGGNGERAR